MEDNDKSEYKILKIILRDSSEIYLTFINLFCYNKYPSFTKYNILSHYLKYYIKIFQQEGKVFKVIFKKKLRKVHYPKGQAAKLWA